MVGKQECASIYLLITCDYRIQRDDEDLGWENRQTVAHIYREQHGRMTEILSNVKEFTCYKLRCLFAPSIIR